MIKDILLTEATEFHMNVEDKDDLFRKMSKKLFDYKRITDIDQFLNALYKREQEGVTGMVNGLAIPHGLSKCVNTPTVLFCRLDKPIEYESMDGEKIDKIFMLAIPENSSNDHLKILATLSRKLMNQEFVSKLNTIEDTAELLNLL